MAKYGMPYQGSKSRIAEEIIGMLPAGGVFYDLFAGGCAITHAAKNGIRLYAMTSTGCLLIL